MQTPLKLVTGDQDEYFYSKSQNGSVAKTIEYLHKNMPHADVQMIKNANHINDGFEDEVASRVSNFLENS